MRTDRKNRIARLFGFSTWSSLESEFVQRAIETEKAGGDDAALVEAMKRTIIRLQIELEDQP